MKSTLIARFAALPVVVLSTMATAQEVRLYRADQPAAGMKMRESTDMIMDRLKMKAEAGGELLFEATFTGIGRMVDDVEYLSPDEVEVKVRRNRFTAKTLSADLPGNEEVESNALEGHTLTGRRNENRWTFKLAEGEPSDEQQKELDDFGVNFDSERHVYPADPIKVGHQWQVTGTSLAGLLGGSAGVENLEGAMKLKLEGIEKVDGLECARVSVDGTASFDFKADSDEEAESPRLRATLMLKGHVLRSLAHGADLSGDLAGEVTLTGGESSSGIDVNISMKGPIKIASTADFSPDDSKDFDEGESRKTPPAVKPRKPRNID